MFVSAGMCEACGAEDLLFARELRTNRIFLVCAACGAAGYDKENSDHIVDVHTELAPAGWTMASLEEVMAAGFGRLITGEASSNYAALILWYPGFVVPDEIP